MTDHLRINPEKPLLLVDCDEVLALFVHGFTRFLKPRGFDLRMDRFGLFQNIYRHGDSEHLDLAAGHVLFDDFFRFASEDAEPAADAAHSLRRLTQAGVSVVILTNAPGHAREPRSRWLIRHGMDYPLIFNEGLKGPMVAALAGRTRKPTAFVDDLLINLDSAAEAAPEVHRFQLVADPQLHSIAPTAPERHRRIDQWQALREALAQVLKVGSA